jgi:hypothetical protein
MVESEVQSLLGKLSQLKNEIRKVIVGQEAIIEEILVVLGGEEIKQMQGLVREVFREEDRECLH